MRPEGIVKMVRTTKFKAALAIVAIGVSSQASFAATDTSCNPFARGADCNGVASYGSSNGSTFTRYGIVSSRGAYQAPAFAAARGNSEGFGRILRSLPSQARAQAIELGEPTDFDEGEEVTQVSDETDNGVSVVPVPASAALLLAGLGGLVAMRRKKS